GDNWFDADTDIEGFARHDDPGTANQGRRDYAETDLGSNQFSATGTARNFRSNNNAFSLTLPFAFPFYETTYPSVWVSTEGFLQFGSSVSTGDGANTTDKLLANPRIAPLWDNLRTTGTGDDIFTDTTVANQITIRWNATNEADGSDVHFAVTLFSDGRIRFH